MDRSGNVSVEDSHSKDVNSLAHDRETRLLAGHDFWTIDPDKSKVIDRVVAQVEKILSIPIQNCRNASTEG